MKFNEEDKYFGEYVTNYFIENQFALWENITQIV